MFKKINNDEIEDCTGPMNQVAKDDALAWTGISDLTTADERQRRTVIAKMQKAKRSSKKHDRQLSKELTRMFTDQG